MYAIEHVLKMSPFDKNTEGSKVVEKKAKKTTHDKDFFSSCFQEACNEVAREMGYKSKKTKS